MQTQLTFLPEDSPASHSAPAAKEKAQRITATSGQKCLEQFGRFPRATLWARTFAALLIGMEGWYSTRCKLTWKLKATKCSRFYFQLAVSELPTEGTGFGLLHTPTVTQIRPTPERIEKRIAFRKSIGRNSYAPGNLTEQIYMGLLPTPVVMYTREDWTLEEINKKRQEVKERTNSREDGMKTGNGFGLNLAQVARMLPTPRASEWKGVGPIGSKSHQHMIDKDYLCAVVQEQTGQSGQLNPLFVMEMMGFPPTHTLEPFKMKIQWTEI